MKTVEKQLLPGQKIKVRGDLIVEGDVGARAQITIEDGSLTVMGNVHPDVAIRVAVSEKMRSASVIQNLNLGTDITSFTLRQGGLVTMGRTISATMKMGKHHIGNVRIDNRIYSEKGIVTDLGGNKYQILPSADDTMMQLISGKPLTPVTGLVTATIDGVNYEGHKILVDGEAVYVDDVIKNNVTPSGNTASESTTPPNVIIKGSVLHSAPSKEEFLI